MRVDWHLARANDGGESYWKLRCPDCGHWFRLSEEQFAGRAEIECPAVGCGFHERVDLSAHRE